MSLEFAKIEHFHNSYKELTSYAGFGFSTISGAWSWLDENSSAVGALCSIIGLVVGVVFGYLNYRSRKQEAAK